MKIRKGYGLGVLFMIGIIFEFILALLYIFFLRGRGKLYYLFTLGPKSSNLRAIDSQFSFSRE
jgi:hypothetical protein